MDVTKNPPLFQIPGSSPEILTLFTLGVADSQAKSGEEDDVDEVDQEVGEIDEGSEPVPFVVEQSGD